jgi:Domain of unknown function (DUF4136)
MRIHPFRAHFRWLAVATAILISACAASPPIHRETNPAASLKSYKTVAFIPTLATEQFPSCALLTQHLKDATRRSLKAKGYVFNDRTPDLLINFYVNMQVTQEVSSSPERTYIGLTGGYYAYRAGSYRTFNTTVEGVDYKPGTLTIDLVDAKQRVLAWTATAEGRVPKNAINDPGPAIDTLVIDMMIPLPWTARKNRTGF